MVAQVKRCGKTADVAEVRCLVELLGGRFSCELGIDVDAGPGEIERWFLAATLFGTRIPVGVAMRSYRVLEGSGIRTIGDVAGVTWERLVELLDAGGYVRYDFRTASRLQKLEQAVRERHDGRISTLGAALGDPATLEAALDALPGWGPVTVRLFLRELRGTWPGARPAVDAATGWAAVHLGLLGVERGGGEAGEGALAGVALAWLESTARQADLDVRDLEAALVRLALVHRRGRRACPGGERCFVWTMPFAGRRGSP
jgi:hypothetical protein